MVSCRRVVVIGTDTDVGKTVLSLLIMQFLIKSGKTPFYIKPFQTGCVSTLDTMGDASFIHSHTPGLKDVDPSASVLNCHMNPKSPWFSARDMGQTIDVAETIDRIREKEAGHSHLVIEASGGLLVPLTDTLTVADFVKASHGMAVIAARAGLGTINHTLMTVECLKARGITPGGIVFLDTQHKMDAQDKGEAHLPTMIQENMEAVEKFSGIPVAGVIGRVIDFKAPSKDALETVGRLLQGL